MSDLKIPRFIALCGNPNSGKSLVQQFLLEHYNVQPVDDGYPLREFAVNNLGCTWDQVQTQEGKKEYVEILGRQWQVREILGELGNRFEAMFGAHVMPFMATARIAGQEGSFSFGSVRRDQGLFYKARGGVVIGIHAPHAGPPKYEFDKFDESVPDYWIVNDALANGMAPEDALEDLRDKVQCLMGEIMFAESRRTAA